MSDRFLASNCVQHIPARQPVFRLVHPLSPVRNRTKKEISQLAIKSQLAPLGGRRGCAQTCDFIAARFALYFRQLFTSRAVRCTQPVLRALKNKPAASSD